MNVAKWKIQHHAMFAVYISNHNNWKIYVTMLKDQI